MLLNCKKLKQIYSNVIQYTLNLTAQHSRGPVGLTLNIRWQCWTIFGLILLVCFVSVFSTPLANNGTIDGPVLAYSCWDTFLWPLLAVSIGTTLASKSWQPVVAPVFGQCSASYCILVVVYHGSSCIAFIFKDIPQFAVQAPILVQTPTPKLWKIILKCPPHPYKRPSPFFYLLESSHLAPTVVISSRMRT